MKKGMSKPLRFICVSSIFAILFNFSVTNMAARYILGELGGNTSTIPYTIAFFGIGNTITIPLALTLKDRIGLKKMLIWVFALFTVVSFLLTFSPTSPVFFGFRFLQGAASGPIFVLIASIVGEHETDEGKENFFREVLFFFIIAPTLGASFGGTFAYFLNWRWFFVIDAAILTLLTCGIAYELKNIQDRINPLPFDGIGYLFYVLGIFSLCFCVIMGQEIDWFRSNLFITFFLIGIVALLFFIIWTIYHPYPILNLRLLKNFQLTSALVYLGSLFGMYFGMIVLLSLWLNIYVNYTVNWVGIALFAMALSATLVIFIVRIAHRQASLYALLAAIFFIAASSFYTMHFNAEVNFGRIAISRIIAGFGIALFLPPLFRLITLSCKPEKRLEAITFFQVTRTLSSSLGVSIFTTLWLRRDVFFHSRLGSGLTEFSENLRLWFLKIKPFGLKKLMEKEELELALSRQSRALALDDCFYLMGWISVGLFICLVIYILYDKYKAGEKRYENS